MKTEDQLQPQVCAARVIGFPDILREIDRIKENINSGFFGDLSYEQMGKLHKELWILESTVKHVATRGILSHG